MKENGKDVRYCKKRVLATVKNTALEAVFPIKRQFPKLGQEKKSYKYSIKSVSHLIIIKPIVN